MAKVGRQAAAKLEAGRLELSANFARIFWDDVAERITGLVKHLVEER